jgi:hypothetical protein
METTAVQLIDGAGQPISGSRGLIWGNNAAWLCAKCDRLLGNRTGDTEFRVSCACGARYEIKRGENKSGNRHLGPAVGILALGLSKA